MRLPTEMRRGILKLVIIKKIHGGEVYPYAIAKAIIGSRHLASLVGAPDMAALKNDVYNAINTLEHEGYIRLRGVTSTHGRKKKHYLLTRKGAKVIERAKRLIRRAMGELLMEI